MRTKGKRKLGDNAINDLGYDDITAFYAEEAEQSVLGGLMIDNDRWDEVVPLLRPEDFLTSSSYNLAENV